MKKILLKIFLTLTLSITSVVQAESIKSIEILGLNTISRGTVLSYLPVEVGDDYSKRTSVKIIRALYETNFFKDIEVSQSDQVLKIKLQENPYIKHVELLNISDKVIKEESIKQILKSMGLSQGKIFNKRQLNKLISQLEASYISKGYYGIKITKTVKVDTQNRVGIELNVNEGEVARISDMKIIGAKVHDEDDLLDLFEIGKSDFLILNYFTKRDHYSKIALDAGIEAMKSLYTNAGYLDFQVSKIDTILSEDKKNISINIQINEGFQYKVGNIKFSGNSLNYSSDDLNNLLTIAKGDVFDRKKIIESIRSITDLFTDQGYAFAEINVVTKEDLKTHTIGLDFNTSLNKRVYINRITIVGNTRTQDDVIRREIGIAEGGMYSNKELDESIKNIKRLGFFSDVKMEVSKVKNFSDKINLNFQLEETKTGDMTLGLSHSNSTGASFEAGINERNFLGTGTTLNAKLSNSSAVKEISFYFKDPYFTKDNHSISYGVFSKSTIGKELGLVDYNIDKKGISIGYGIPLTKSTNINAKLTAASVSLSCGYQLGGTDGPDIDDDGDPIVYATSIQMSDNNGGFGDYLGRKLAASNLIITSAVTADDTDIVDGVIGISGKPVTIVGELITSAVYATAKQVADKENDYLGNPLSIGYNIITAPQGEAHFANPDDISQVKYGVTGAPVTIVGELITSAVTADDTDIVDGVIGVSGEPVTIVGELITSAVYANETDIDAVKYGEDGHPISALNTVIRSGSDIDTDTYKGLGLETAQCNSGDTTEIKLSLGWSGDTLNDFYNPTDGHRNSLSLDLALPIGDYRYYKLNANHKSYYPMGNDLTLKFNANINIGQGYGGKELPFFERYHGGGSSSVRGFEFNSLGEKYDGTNTAKGGELLLLSGVSIISPMNFINDSKNMRMSAFVDAGGIYPKAGDINLDDLRMSAGVAISWLTPIGPLGIYVAKPILKKDGDNTKTVEFTLGTSF